MTVDFGNRTAAETPRLTRLGGISTVGSSGTVPLPSASLLAPAMQTCSPELPWGCCCLPPGSGTLLRHPSQRAPSPYTDQNVTGVVVYLSYWMVPLGLAQRRLSQDLPRAPPPIIHRQSLWFRGKAGLLVWPGGPCPVGQAQPPPPLYAYASITSLVLQPPPHPHNLLPLGKGGCRQGSRQVRALTSDQA